MKSAYKSPIVT